MAEKHQYDHADIRRYLDNQMTPGEMHAFEKAMLEDAFLADATEGYEKANTKQALKDLHTIKASLQPGSGKSAAVPMRAQSSTRWWRIAALVIVLAGAGGLVFSVLNEQPTRKEMAAASPRPARDAMIEKRESTDTTMLPEKTLLAANEPQKSNPLIAMNRRVAPPQPIHEQADTAMQMAAGPVQVEQGNLNKTSTGEHASLQSFSKAAAPQALREFRGNVLNDSGRPLAMANIESENKVHTVTDNKGNFSIVSPDTTLAVTISSIGYPSTQVHLKGDSSNSIVLNRNDQALSEVVVVGYGSSKRKETSVVKQRSAAAQSSLSNEPVGGWQNFNKYVNHLNTLTDTTGNLNTSAVTLEFLIDKNGKPENIVVVTPVDKKTAVKAIELLENGPRWRLKTKELKTRVTLPVNNLQ